tara:strand:+ start:713 stop:1459 length:747 start_codon:yes stop_codon:yes gene_type:complete
MKKMKKLTVILPTKNSSTYIKYFLNSLKEQDFQDFILYLADSSSQDNTIEIVKEYNFDLKVISKEDKNAEDGINKCLEKVETSFFCILMSDDKLGEKNYLSQLINTLESGADIAIPNFGTIINDVSKIKDQKKGINDLLYHNIAPDIGWMGKASVLREGMFTQRYKLATAYHFLLRLYKKKYVLKRNENIHYFFRLGGNSFNGFLAFFEQAKVSLEFGANKLWIYKILVVNFLKYFIKYKLLKFYFKV